MNPQEQEVMLVELTKKLKSDPSKFDKWQTSALTELVSGYDRFGKLTEKMVSNVLLKIYNQQFPKDKQSKLLSTLQSNKNNNIRRFEPSSEYLAALKEIKHHNFVLNEETNSGSFYEVGDYKENYKKAFISSLQVIRELQQFINSL